jgi:hypothetical protein
MTTKKYLLCPDSQGRRTFLKTMGGGIVLLGSAGIGLGSGPGVPASGATKAELNSSPENQTSVMSDDWNEMEDPGWSY